MKVLSSSKTWQDAKLNFGKTKLSLFRVAAHAVITPHGPLEASTKRGPIDGTHIFDQAEEISWARSSNYYVLDGTSSRGYYT